MEKQHYKDQEVIFSQGEYQKYLYSICSGSVDIYADYGTKDEKKLATLHAGRFFGEIGMIGMMPRTATAVAASESVTLLQVTYDDLEDYLKDNPEHIRQLMHNVSGRIRELTDEFTLVNRAIQDLLLKRGREENSLKASLKKLIAGLKGRRWDSETALIRPTEKLANSDEFPPIANFYSGDVIFRAGDSAECLYEIYSGKVGIYTDYGTKNEKLLSALHMEAIFGEMGVLDDMPRSATAVCLEDCSLLLVRKEHFMLFFQKKPMKVLHILQQMCIQLRNLSGEYLQLCKTLEALSVQADTETNAEPILNRISRLSELRTSEDAQFQTASARQQ